MAGRPALAAPADRAELIAPARTAARGDKAAVVALLARAFADDPAMCWIFPDPADRAVRLPRLFGILYDSDVTGLRVVTAGGEAATLWRPPGRAQAGGWEMIRRAVPLLRALGPHRARAMRVADAIDAHMPAGSVWYLHIAGCDPAQQGRGFGASAVRGGLDRVGATSPVYLETATEGNLGFYQGLGFAVTGEWRVPGDGPRFWSMLRAPDSAPRRT